MSIYIPIISSLIICLLIDIILFFKVRHLSFKGSVLLFLFWVAVTLIFFAFLHFGYDPTKAKEFIVGYTLERTLSLDNIFVFYVIFSFFKINEEGKERIIFWGILLAIVLRILFILAGAVIIAKFSFVLYLFGLFLIFTGIKLLIIKDDDKEKDFEQNTLVKIFKKLLKTTPKFEGDKFYIIENGVKLFTPLFIVMLLIAFSDIIFALDSIPAIFGITLDPLIVITANFFSLMGLRAIFFLITHVIDYFYYIKYALSVILVFIGIKMLIAGFYHIPISFSLMFIFASIAIAIIFSIIKKPNIKK